ncbi:hypothetical protein FKZ61_015260 [Litorilinea aerophila]|uniref:Uncharacterized protein n=1 Tax=Litorilinea aerophila TaxID=1204385 RepID=A0A540VDE4_9CHLR|nr:hypothetical protein [Litorilinea aerophila]MCC9077460.1 hypothetical protein [Litorilinea aerophila]OUC08270.1 hypothetical protein RY27_09970 [Litorilinea aerophila]GIV77571.1 MAG: hypothetical protein KatS3mg050_1965 [Litorilinea sp.]
MVEPEPGSSRNLFRSLSADQLMAVLLVAAGIALTLFFGMRFVRAYRHVGPPAPGRPAPQVEEIRGWMTIGYLSAAFHLPPDYLFQALGLPPDEDPRRPLRVLARKYAPDDPERFMEAVREAIRAYQAAHPPPPRP